MSIFDELEVQYNDINNEYSAIEFKARSKPIILKQRNTRNTRKKRASGFSPLSSRGEPPDKARCPDFKEAVWKN